MLSKYLPGVVLAPLVLVALSCHEAASATGISASRLSEAFVTIGDGIHSVGDFTGDDEQPFLLALDTLEEGGTIQVGAGEYRFSQPVVIDQAHTHLASSGAVLRASSDPTTGLFSVVADHVRLTGFELRDHAPAAGHALVTVTASDFRLRDCTFFGGAGAGSPAFVQLHGPAQDRWIQDNRFHSAGPWTAVRAEGGEGIQIEGNHFSGQPQEPIALEYAFHLVDESRGVVQGNVFRNVGDPSVQLQALLYVENTHGEQHHLVIADNFLHDVRALRVLELRGSHFNVITGNSFGRIVGAVAVIDLAPSNVSGPSGTTISGNDFHNPGMAPSVRINGGFNHTISGNGFTLSSHRSVEIGNAQSVDSTLVSGNQFNAQPISIGVEPAITIQGGARHAVHSNAFYRYTAPAVDIKGVALIDYSLEANFER